MSNANIRIAAGADHGGVELKNAIVQHLRDQGYQVTDFGTQGKESVDYSDFANLVGRAVSDTTHDYGLLCCTSGIGVSIAANRFEHVNAALVRSERDAELCRHHNNANVICFGGANTDAETGNKLMDIFLSTEFDGGRHERRVCKASGFSLAQKDPELYEAISAEERRQRYNIELIASENFVSRAVMEAQGSVLTNKYAEGYPGRRWYGGCENVDVAESLAISRCKELFGGDHVNVQPHSGSQANMAVYYSVLKPGDRILTMDLAHGGHLTHGHRANFSGRFFEVTHYGVDQETEQLDYDHIAELAREVKPQLITCGASAYPRIIDFERIAAIAKEVGAYLFVDMAHIAGLVAAGLHPSPVPHADFVTSTTHKSLRGPRGGFIICREEFAKKIDSQVFPGIQGGPLMHVIAAKATCFAEALKPEFKAYGKQIIDNIQALANRLTEHGYRIVSGGSDNHLILVDLRPKNLNGDQASKVLDKAGITVNKNAIPFDTGTPMKPSGIRIGSPAATTRGLKESDFVQVADFIDDALTHHEDEAYLAALCEKVHNFMRAFPMPM